MTATTTTTTTAVLTRGKSARGYNHFLTVDGKAHRVCRASNYRYYYRTANGERVYVRFNRYIFESFAEIPMKFVPSELEGDCWEMANEYRQLPGAGCNYEIVGAEPEAREFYCPVCGNTVEVEYGVELERKDGDGTVTICCICENTLLSAGII